jgi:hypothetical protein
VKQVPAKQPGRPVEAILAIHHTIQTDTEYTALLAEDQVETINDTRLFGQGTRDSGVGGRGLEAPTP